VRQVVLTHLPVAHQNLAGSTPELCSGSHKKGCDLEEVEGETPPHITHTQFTFKTMTELNAQFQIIELTDDQLKLVAGGAIPPFLRMPVPPPFWQQERKPPTEIHRY
jgi:hypothetical protein